MESKIEALEFRNKELEHTILNLQERLGSLEEGSRKQYPDSYTSAGNPGISQPNIYSSKSRCNDLIQGIHDRVSTYVLLKVEKQIEKLIDLESDSDEKLLWNDAQMNTGSTEEDHQIMDVTCKKQSEARVSTQAESMESQAKRNENSVHQPVFVIHNANSEHSFPVKETLQRPQDHIVSDCAGYQLGHVNTSVPLPMNNPQYVTGQSLYYAPQGTVPMDRCEKSFLRHSSLINMVN